MKGHMTTTNPTPSMTTANGPTVERRYRMLEKHDVPQLIADAIAEISDGDIDELTAADLAMRLSRHFADVVMWEDLGPRPARNSNHAHRLTVKQRFGDAPGSLDLVAIAENYWVPKRPTNNVKSFVSV